METWLPGLPGQIAQLIASSGSPKPGETGKGSLRVEAASVDIGLLVSGLKGVEVESVNFAGGEHLPLLL